MSTTIDSKVVQVSLKNQGVLGMPGFGDTKYKYFSELTINGRKPNRTFSVDLYREEDGLTTRVAYRNDVGRLDQVLIEGIYQSNEQERALYLTVDKQTKLPLSYWEGLIGDNGLETLTAEEKNRLSIATGNNNVALNSNTAGAVFVGGADGTDADGTPAVEQTDQKKQETTDPTKPVFADIEVELKISRKGRSSYGNYYYPADLETNKQDRIRFEMKYTEGTVVNATIESHTKQFQRKVENIGGSVTLPIVTGIADINEVEWEGAKLNPLQALGAGAALQAFDSANSGEQGVQAAIRGFGGAAGNLGKEIRQVGGDLKTALNVYLAQQAVGTQNLLSRTTGAIVNPNLEMLFSGPALRKFGFTFKLSPRDANEANQVRKILRFFKQGMSVKTSDSNVFLKAPNVFDINYQTFDGTREISHPSINKIKTCALLACDVQYTPDGTYMTYDDPSRTMTSYQLTLQFNELDPIYDTDYTELDNDKDTTIGY